MTTTEQLLAKVERIHALQRSVHPADDELSERRLSDEGECRTEGPTSSAA